MDGLPPFDAPAEAQDDAAIAARLLPGAQLAPAREARIDVTATRLIEAIRAEPAGLGGVEDLLHEFALSSREGLALMVLAEALLRVPDAATAERFIEDRLGRATLPITTSNRRALGVASAWALGLSAKMVTASEEPFGTLGPLAGSDCRRCGWRSGRRWR